MCTTTIASKAGSNKTGLKSAIKTRRNHSAKALLFALQLTIGLALANASLPGDTLQSVHLADFFGIHQSRDLDGQARSLLFGTACGCRRREHHDDFSPNACPGGKF